MTQTIRLVNFSTKLTDDVVSKIAEAVNQQVQEDLIPAWGLTDNYAIVSGTQSGNDWAISLVDATDSNALGWHADNKSPYGQIDVTEILDYGGAALNGVYPTSPSVSSVCSHEVIEMILDPLADSWVDVPATVAGATVPAGTQVAKEGCDPCQSFSYQKGTIDVSDFVLPAWFDGSSAGASAPAFDFLKHCPGAFQLAPGGYMILKAADGSTSQVFGDTLPSLLWQKRVGRKFRRQQFRPIVAV